ncbi:MULTISPECIES: TetR/AcrR family transcriptional regulator [unclassified Streptomyces]|uniref:TetR/AcrR family transcriptional regulator n=1 Tax=unclassified Streptomyces TaxID=2593676 RepID=UPI0001D060C3|nr:TetR/AcrR family transcriptional regulator [Streptomyces sp. e14]EFF93867.1 TetR family transcriptional regulator [Streptomyces sp. e14]MYS41389.1 TetR family transcriptional regulator [Streptomyces sp. SID5998]MYX44180.1 TetR family transcriptional regulator [Streptomyces sp. SID89]NED74561.1 TetR/AcrR family transcriptional regulator [Streptomyces sp. SID9944]
MARPRTFDEERALDAAMRTFWEKGYEATSTQDLCDATGLGRSSIYNTFKSKHDLFERALARYIDSMTSTQLAVLEDRRLTAAERIRTLLAMVVDGETEHRAGGRSLGCLTVNTTVELAARDSRAAGMLERDTARRLAALRAVLEEGRRDGSITSRRDAGALARFVNAAIGGMRISSQGGADRSALESIADVTLDALTA